MCFAWLLDIHSWRTPLPHPRTRFHSALVCRPPDGHERHNPLRGRERDGAWTRGSAWIGATPGCMPQRLRRRGRGTANGRELGILIGRAMTHYVHGNAGGRAIVVSPPGIPKATPYPIPLPESEGRAAPHRPSGNPNGTATAAMDVDQFPPPETPKAAPCPIAPPGIRRPHVTPSPRRESQGRTLPHRPSGNPKVVPRPIPPPGIPTGFCHKARGCAAEALPRVKSKNINNPNGVVPNVHRVGCTSIPEVTFIK